MQVGVQVTGRTVVEVIDAIKQAESLGIHCAWMTSGGTAPDPLTIYAAAATQTTRINFGTAIIQTFPRHPLALVQQAIVLNELAPGRVRLGVGPSGAQITQIFGIPFERPQEHLREYVQVLRQAFAGTVDFDGKRIQAHGKLSAPADVKVMASALRVKAFELCGEVADGAISWLCPPAYLRDVAKPAMAAAAKAAGRETPLLVAHVLVCATADYDLARAAVRNGPLGFFARIPNYQAMFADAGFPEARDGAWSDAMIDAVTIHGDVATVERRLRELASYGIDELMVSVLGTTNPEDAQRGLRLVGRVASHQ